LYKGGEDSCQHEGGKQDDLHASLRGIGLVETEPNEQSGANTEAELGEDVAGQAPILLENTVSDLNQLLTKRHGKLRRGGRVVGASNFFMLFIFMNAFNVLFNNLSHVAPLPDVVPVFTLVVLPSVDDFEHVLRWVLVVSALAGTVVLIVFEQFA